MNLNKVKKALFTTLLVFSVPALSIYTPTNSKYMLDSTPEKELNYNISTKKLTIMPGQYTNIYYHKSQSEETSNKHYRLQFSFTFDRNQLMAPGDNFDTYTVHVNNGCKIDSINENNDINLQEASYTYGHANAATVSVKYHCDMSEDELKNDLYNTDVKIYESFNKESNIHRFNVLSINRPVEKSELPALREFYESEDKKSYYIKKDYENYETVLTNWIKSKDSTIYSYFSNTYTSLDLMKSTVERLPGLKVTDEGKYYKYTISDTYYSYANTYLSASHYYFFIQNENINLTLEETKELFNYYLKNYSSFSDDEILEINEYIRSNTLNSNEGSIYNVINNLQTIKGIEYNEINNYIKLVNIMKYIHPNTHISLDYTDTSIFTNYQREVDTLDVISDVNKSKIKIDTQIIMKLMEKSNTSKYDYYYFDNDNQQFMVIILSDGDNKKYEIDIVVIKQSEEYNLKFMVSDITSTDISKITNVLNNFDTALDYDPGTLSSIYDNGVDPPTSTQITYNDIITGVTYQTSNDITVTITNVDNVINVNFTSK